MQNPASSQPAHLGQTIGAYELTEKLDESASIIVFRARDPLLNRQVIVKQLLLTVQISDDTRERIEQYRKLSHQHKRIVNIVELIDDAAGIFLVSEYLAGDSLDTWLTRGQGKTGGENRGHGKPIKPPSVLRILRSITMALEILHQQNMTHRDLRPGNLIVTSAGTVQIADLGLADLIVEQETLGLESVRYMPPELCRGEIGDPRSDLYSLGLIAYEMLVGRTAFENMFKSVLRDTRQQAMRWMKWHTNLRATLPPACKVNDQVPTLLSELVARLIEKDPVKRIASARQLIEAIERNFDASQTATSPKTTPTTTPKNSAAGDTLSLPKPSRKPIIIAFVLGVLLIGGIVWFTANGLARQQARQQHLAETRATLDQAKQFYKTGDFSQAQKTYRHVTSQFDTNTRFGEVAAAGVLLCQARLQMLDADYTTARNTLEEVDDTAIFGRETLRALFDEVDHRIAMAQATEKIQQQIDTGQFAQAQHTLRQWRVLVLLDDERQQLNTLHDQLDSRMMQQQVNQILQQVDEWIEADQAATALATLTEANERLHQPALGKRLDALLIQQQIDALLLQAESAEQSKNYSEAIVYYTRAMNLRTSDTLAERLAQAKIKASLVEGRRLFEQGDLIGAQAAFTRALGYGDSDEARGYLARMEVADQKQSLVRAGDQAMTAGEFGAAVRHYTSAQQLDSADTAVQSKLLTAQRRDFISQGHRAINQQNYDAARQAFEAALEVDPEAGLAREGLAELETLLEYLEYLNLGDQFRSKNKFANAKRFYRKAQKTIDDDRIRERLDDVEYDHLIAQARRHLDALQWDAAAARLRSAAKIHNTDTVRQLQQQINRERDDDS